MPDIEFAEWMVELRRIGPEFAYTREEMFEEDWIDFYEDGLTPREALIIDQQAGL